MSLKPKPSYPRFTEDRFQLVWSPSSLKLYQTCKRRYDYEKVLQWSEPFTTNIHLLFGRHFGDSITHFWTIYSKTKDREASLHAACKHWLKSTHLNAYFQAEEIKTRSRGLSSLIDYLDFYFKIDEKTLYKTRKGSALEEQYLIQLNETFSLMGYFDRVVKMGNQLLIMDQKTTGKSLDKKFFQDFHLATQTFGYLYAGNIIFPEPVTGFIVDGISIQKRGVRFVRHRIQFTPSQIDEWHSSILDELEEYSKKSRKTKDDWPMNPSACYFCPFKKVCEAAPELRPAILKNNYKKAQDVELTA